ncbi:MAG: WbuC family cupin fold metalloprotein [Thermodesulfobacteriota bacterium]|nr:WbuC family cupin fold metalloprotein [Thermodesulfobacteriota bacterium]
MNNNATVSSFPLAMESPDGKMTIITAELIKSAVDMSRKSPRGRIICPFHKSDNDNLHRMLNVIQPYSYVQPHRHSNPPKAETVIVLKGSLAYIIFNEDGRIEDAIKLSNQSDKIGIDTQPKTYHTFFALEQDTVLFEIKPGPYRKRSDKDLAEWAPKESTDNCKEYLESLYKHIDSRYNKGI